MKTIALKINKCSKFSDTNIMRKINLRLSDIVSFKYSILISLHYYDISFYPERISKLKPFENKYNFVYITPNEFEINNSNTWLIVFHESNKRLYTPKNNGANKAQIDWKMIDMQQ